MIMECYGKCPSRDSEGSLTSVNGHPADNISQQERSNGISLECRVEKNVHADGLGQEKKASSWAVYNFKKGLVA